VADPFKFAGLFRFINGQGTTVKSAYGSFVSGARDRAPTRGQAQESDGRPLRRPPRW
jgi:hypothetical protein